ncbi:uncharacterized protein F4822DRAFT_424741 [Hypoxylon trugodes]|uniref:uncharacterized protein n=1 Tax=Hypoxylon trugodes TaxID=326681 RepID=UPI0021A1D569|nr:uncharacterized protein F4822DRAFT_424741 [Hypoxylon trugodes]KAI1394263.1 hypothetical protein F4822DRAFT_424741 [Hypoxylon trugodes]
MSPKCNNNSCDKASSDELRTCSGCKKTQYCSKDCQKQDWKQHKAYCHHITSNGAISASLSAVAYHLKVAANDPEAQALARYIRVTLPVMDEFDYSTVADIVLRLTITGRDSPENFSLLFGQNDRKMVTLDSRLYRYDVLQRPPPASYAYRSESAWGSGLPYTPREPCTFEASEAATIRDMQERIRHHMGSRLAEINCKDMEDILTSLGVNESKRWNILFAQAVRCMDVGRPLSYSEMMLLEQTDQNIASGFEELIKN